MPNADNPGRDRRADERSRALYYRGARGRVPGGAAPPKFMSIVSMSNRGIGGNGICWARDIQTNGDRGRSFVMVPHVINTG